MNHKRDSDAYLNHMAEVKEKLEASEARQKYYEAHPELTYTRFAGDASKTAGQINSLLGDLESIAKVCGVNSPNGQTANTHRILLDSAYQQYRQGLMPANAEELTSSANAFVKSVLGRGSSN